MVETPRIVVGGLVAGALLALYVYVLVLAVLYAVGITHKEPTANAFWILQTIGALVSALVTAVLALAANGSTGSGGATKLHVLGVPAEGPVAILAIAYLVAWLACGFVAVVVGLLQYKVEVPQLGAYARAWIGVAIVAAYAYFGLPVK
ncbi:MAG: hypothetical protein ACJ8EB_03395 [Allosphingosinicella sp.]